MTHSVEDFWQAYIESLPPGEEAPVRGYSTWHFCDHEACANELARLALDGIKTATCGLLWSYEAEGEAIPQPGDFSVVTDWQGQPVCIIRTVEVEIKPFDQVDAAFAYDEGEGDRSYAYWRREHWRFFSRACRSLGRLPLENMPLVCERFCVIFPRRT
jgi:uncharacterized protein YhfF